MPGSPDWMTTFPSLAADLLGGMRDGLHVGAQIYVSKAGEEVGNFAIGEARPGVEMRRDSLTLWMSSTKPLVAIAIARLWEREQLDLTQEVATIIPEFGQNGKDSITIGHVLTHTGGFRLAPFRFPADGWDTIIEKICAARLEPRWVPGEKSGYHPYTGWFILGEVVERVSDRPFAEFMRDEVLLPCGMTDSWIGMPEEAREGYGDRIAMMMNTEEDPPVPTDLTEPAALAVPNPGANGCGPIRELGLFYEMLLNHGKTSGGDRVVRGETVHLFTGRRRVGMFDHSFKHVLDWGLGFIVDSKQSPGDQHAYGYGPHASRHTFGHSGNQSSVAFADPAHKLVVALLFSGMPGEAAHQERVHRALGSLYEDLGLA